MKLRRLKNGRIKDMDTGLFVNKKLAKSFANGKKIPLLKSTNHTTSHKAKKINYPKYRAINIIKIRQYRDGTFSADFGHRNISDQDLLYLGEYFKQMAEKKININIKKNVNPDAWK